MKSNDIKKLEAAGFKRWTRGDVDRLYIDATKLGLSLDYYNSGNIRSAEFDGETISNSMARKVKSTKVWVDIKTGSVHFKWTTPSSTGYEETLAERAESLMHEIIDETEKSEDEDLVFENEDHDDEVREARESIQRELDERLESAAEFYDYPELKDSIRFYGSTMSWSSLGEVSLEEAELFADILKDTIVTVRQRGIDQLWIGDEEEFHIDMADVDLPRVSEQNQQGLDFIEFNGNCGGQFFMSRSIPAAVEQAWDREETGENLIIDIEGLDHEDDRAEVDSHLAGYGSALALMSSINDQYRLTPGDLQVNIGMVRMEQLLADYAMVLDQLPDAPSKWAMAMAWAYTIDQHLEEEEFVPGVGIDKPDWLERMLSAEGDFAGHHVTIIYTIDKKEE